MLYYYLLPLLDEEEEDPLLLRLLPAPDEEEDELPRLKLPLLLLLPVERLLGSVALEGVLERVG